MSEWKECKIQDVIARTIDNRGKNPPYSIYGYEVIETSCISGKKKFPDYMIVRKYVSKECYQNWFRAGHPQKDDLLIITVGNGIGNVSIMKYNRGCITQNLIGLRFNSEIADSNFYYYYLSMDSIQEYLSGLDIGSAQPSLKVLHILHTEIPLPPLPEQRAIAAVLSSLDDKIDLLHRQNKTLEAMAETLFRQWFVEEADEGWEVQPLGNLVTVRRGGSPRPIQDYLSETGLRWLKISDATKEDSPYIFEIREHIKESGLNKTVFLKKGTLVLSNSATPGIPKILQVDSCIHDGWLHFPKSYFSKEFLYLLFKSIREELISHGNGSIFTNLKTDILKDYKIPIPEKAQLQIFQESVELMFEKILENANQIRTLEALRDTLLPKLMSGEVRIKLDAEAERTCTP